MPQTQALAFAIRTRPVFNTSQIRRYERHAQQLQSVAQTYIRGHTSKCTASKTSSLLRQVRNKLSPLRLAIIRRHLTSVASRSRPQAPYLSSYHDSSLRASFNRFIRQRYLTTATKKRWKEQFRFQLRFQAIFWPMYLLLYTVWMGIEQIQLEHEFPTPSEWSFWTRWDGRAGKTVLSVIEENGYARPGQWARAANYFLTVLGKLEPGKRTRSDNRGVKSQEETRGAGPTLIDGLGEVGFDISAKSEKWRHGYYEVLMALGRISENLDGLCKRKGKKLTDKTVTWKWDHIPGPDNPRPVPVEWRRNGSHKNVPNVTEVENVIDPPETFYLKILTCRDFSNRQRLEAALAYADWADFKGLKDTAANMHDWALDIAAGGLPEGADHVVDMQTGVINAGKERFVSENLLKATTALGVWHATNGEVKEALPIFLSVLRARKALPPAPISKRPSAISRKVSSAAEAENRPFSDALTGFFENMVDFFSESDEYFIRSSGDEQPYHSLKEACEEVGIMTYIGEILFATSEQEREKGLSWTRDSVGAAEAILWLMDEQDNSANKSGREKCTDCLQTGLANWEHMTQQMTRLAKQKEQAARENKGWLGIGLGQGNALEKATEDVNKWEDEAIQIGLRHQKVASLLSTLKPGEKRLNMNSMV